MDLELTIYLINDIIVVMKEAIERTFYSLAKVDSVSKNESAITSLVTDRLVALGFDTKRDEIGNVIGFLPGAGQPILLNAHLDGVPPGKGHIPLKSGDILKSDGSTNLRADDIAGVAIILEAANVIVTEQKAHPPLVVAFTVQEEIGLWGAKALNLAEYGVTQGIVFDNAFEAGSVVSQGSAYVAFDVEIIGKETHPGKDLTQGANAIQVLLDTGIRAGEADDGKTRVNIGILSAGKARNVVPGNLTLQGEVRSFLQGQDLKARVDQLQSAFTEAAERNRAEVKFSTKQLALAYKVDSDEPLLQTYKNVVEQRGGIFEMKETFVASDANALRGEKGLNVFVVSTGVRNEHSVEETVDLSELEQLGKDLVKVLELASTT